MADMCFSEEEWHRVYRWRKQAEQDAENALEALRDGEVREAERLLQRSVDATERAEDRLTGVSCRNAVERRDVFG